MDSEHIEQAQLVNWLETNHPEILFFAIPNGASLAGRGRQMNRLKAEGLLPGTADLEICEPRGRWHGCFVEMKTEKGKLSPNQSWFLAEAEKRHYYTICAHGFEQARELVGEYLSWVE